MKSNLYTLCLLLILPTATFAQNFKWYPGDYPVVQGQDSLRLISAFAGGLVSPQFSNIDFNADGIQDLFVFDRLDGKVLTFINDGNQQAPRYLYSPQYESAFPEMINFALLVDYNNDGKPDIFTYSPWGGGIAVYKNISTAGNLAFKMQTDLLLYDEQGYRTNIYTASIDLPSFVDVNGDGKLDILAFDVGGGYVRYYKNISQNVDSLHFRIEDNCWGKMLEGFSSNAMLLGVPCFNVQWPDSFHSPLPKDETVIITNPEMKKHEGGTLLAFDRDGDGDIDILIGDIEFSNLVYLENGRVQHNAGVDTMVSVDSTFPAPQAKMVDVNIFPGAYYVDVNNDGKKDLLVSPFDAAGSQTLNQIWLYTNTGTTANPAFQYTKNNFLQEHMIDLGQYTSPVFFDYDGDGDLDLLVATQGDLFVTQDSADVLVLYENIGDAQNPEFMQSTYNYLQLSNRGYKGLAPAMGDLTGDGRADLLIGKVDGKLDLYRNTSTSGAANFVLHQANFAGIDVGDYSRPAIYDVNGDGLNDLIIGESKGNLNYYRNNGPANNPTFTLVTDSLGAIRTNAIYYQYEYDNNGKPIDSTKHYYFTGFSSPVVGDINNNGIAELVVGSEQGQVYIYEIDTANLTAAWPALDTMYYDMRTGMGQNYDFGLQSHPAIADINGDTLMDLMVGQYRGGLMFFSSRNNPVTTFPPVSVKEKPIFGKLQIYPNPAEGKVYIAIDEKQSPYAHSGKNFTVTLYSMIGVQVQQRTINIAGGIIELPLNNVSQGLYLIKATAENGSQYTGKLFVK